jgi:hypothetical protein
MQLTLTTLASTTLLSPTTMVPVVLRQQHPLPQQ